MVLGLGSGCAEDPTLTREGGPLPSNGGAGGSGGGDPVPFCAAFKVIQDKCQRCHGDPLKNAAPVPFLTYEDTQAQYYMTDRRWWEVMIPNVEKDMMPYVFLNDPPTSLMPPVEPLTADEKATLLGWLKQGAKPEGGTDCP